VTVLDALGGQGSSAFAISDAGQIVGYAGFPGESIGGFVAVIWDGDRISDLNTRIPENRGVRLIQASAINKGQIACIGFNAGARQHIFLLMPESSRAQPRGPTARRAQLDHHPLPTLLRKRDRLVLVTGSGGIGEAHDRPHRAVRHLRGYPQDYAARCRTDEVAKAFRRLGAHFACGRRIKGWWLRRCARVRQGCDRACQGTGTAGFWGAGGRGPNRRLVAAGGTNH
jgi:hypothetical protein